MKFLITFEKTEKGYSVQVPDLAIITHGKSIEKAKESAKEAIRINLETYHALGKELPELQPVINHLVNPDFSDLLFAFADIPIHKNIGEDFDTFLKEEGILQEVEKTAYQRIKDFQTKQDKKTSDKVTVLKPALTH
jgi:predicted RNase H-like HicB family nuclease